MKKSFKVLLSAAILLSATLNANAQLLKKDSPRVPDRLHMGVRGGLTSNFFTDYEPYLFPTGGLAIDYQIASVPLFLGAGLNYVNYVLYDDHVDNSQYSSNDLDEYNGAVQIPVTASYHINVAPNLFINPFLGFFVAWYPDSYFEESFNYGLRLGCGVNYGRFTLEFGYDAGLANHSFGKHNQFSDIPDQKSNTLFLTVGFNWTGKR